MKTEPTFTPEPPTKPGWYLWTRFDGSALTVGEVRLDPYNNRNVLVFHTHYGSTDVLKHRGLWCRLVPAEEVERAWREAQKEHGLPNDVLFYRWGNSRAKRIADGDI